MLYGGKFVGKQCRLSGYPVCEQELMALFTIYVFLNKNAVPDALKKEVELKC